MKTNLVVSIYLVILSAIFMACWAVIFYETAISEWEAGALGVVSGAPIAFAIPFISDRLVSGSWIWSE